MIDRKLEPLVKCLMVKYLGELEDDDLVMFVLEHLKDHKSPGKLAEGLEPVRYSLLCPNPCLANIYVRSLKKKLWSSRLASGDKSFSKVWPMARACIPKEHWSIDDRGKVVYTSFLKWP